MLGAAVAIVAGLGCAAVNRQADRWALELRACKIADQQVAERPGMGLPFRSSEELEEMSRPRTLPVVAVTRLSKHRLDDPTLTQEELTFPSAVAVRFSESQTVHAYVYRHGALGARPVLLWVPGHSVSDGDFFVLRRFFDRVFERDLDIVFFVPPYHLDRTPKGFGSGDAFLATDFSDHLRVFAQELSDVRVLLGWLRSQGVREIGGFGSSMGGAIVLRLVTWEPAFDFLIVMQPVVDWGGLVRRPEMAPVRRRLEAQGISSHEMMLAYHAIDPRGGKPQISSSRISLLYGRFDLIAPEGPILALKRVWGIKRLRVYDRGHAFIALGNGPYRDLGRELDADLAALRLDRDLEERAAARAFRERRADGLRRILSGSLGASAPEDEIK